MSCVLRSKCEHKINQLLSCHIVKLKHYVNDAKHRNGKQMSQQKQHQQKPREKGWKNESNSNRLWVWKRLIDETCMDLSTQTQFHNI